jgi:hypothetical protein
MRDHRRSGRTAMLDREKADVLEKGKAAGHPIVLQRLRLLRIALSQVLERRVVQSQVLQPEHPIWEH